MAGRHGLTSREWNLPGFSPRGERIGRALTGLTSCCVAAAAVYVAVAPSPPPGLEGRMRSPWDRATLVVAGLVFLSFGLEVVVAGPPRPFPARRAVWVTVLRSASVVGMVLVVLAIVARSLLAD